MRKMMMTMLLAGFMAAPVAAQSWDAPMFFAPRPLDDLGLYYVNTDGNFRDANGLQAIWRQSGNINLGVRGGFADLEDIGNSILLGAELYNSLNSLLPSSGIDIAWNLGAGAVFGGDYTVFTVPLGVSIGLRLGSGSVSIAPYVHPRASLDIVAVEIGDEEVTETEGAFAVDLGADINLGPKWILRAGYSLGDRDAFGIGLAMRWPRGISVVR